MGSKFQRRPGRQKPPPYCNKPPLPPQPLPWPLPLTLYCSLAWYPNWHPTYPLDVRFSYTLRKQGTSIWYFNTSHFPGPYRVTTNLRIDPVTWLSRVRVVVTNISGATAVAGWPDFQPFRNHPYYTRVMYATGKPIGNTVHIQISA
jgi:hypothetical protein